MPGAPEFERWADDERTALQHRYRDAVERLARDAESSGSLDDAVKWWRKRVAHDPLNTFASVSLMRALAANGRRDEAIQHARVFEALASEELGIATSLRSPTRCNRVVG